jgi:MFS family permease
MLWPRARDVSHPSVGGQRRLTASAFRQSPWVLVWTLAIAQVVSWGSLYYSFSLFVVPMQETLGWSRPMLNGALSLGLLSTGAVAFPVGAWIDRHGGRSIMSLSSLLGGLLLFAWAQVESPWAFYLVWTLIGVSMAGVLYEPAFAVLTATFGADARRAITALTLVGGFASTVFMPLTQLLIATLGWRQTLLVLGGLNLAVCLPLHALFVPAPSALPAPGVTPEAEVTAATSHEIHAIVRGQVFWGLAIWFTAANVMASGFVFQLVPLLTAWGVGMTAVLTSVALIGPMQVVGRIVLMLFGNRLETREIGTAVVILLPAAVLGLLFLGHTPFWLGLCASLYGAGNGILTIARGTAVADLIGRTHYGAVNGALTIPTMVARSLAPVATAAVWTATGNPSLMLWTLLGSALVGAAGFLLALSGRRGKRAAGSDRGDGLPSRPQPS